MREALHVSRCPGVRFLPKTADTELKLSKTCTNTDRANVYQSMHAYYWGVRVCVAAILYQNDGERKSFLFTLEIVLEFKLVLRGDNIKTLVRNKLLQVAMICTNRSCVREFT